MFCVLPHCSPGQSQGVPQAAVSTVGAASPAVMEPMWMPPDGADPPPLSATSSSLATEAKPSQVRHGAENIKSSRMSSGVQKSQVKGDAWLPKGLAISDNAMSLGGTSSLHDDEPERGGMLSPSSLAELCLSVPIDFDPTRILPALAPKSSTSSMTRSLQEGTSSSKKRRLLAPADHKVADDTMGVPPVTFAATTRMEMDWGAMDSLTRGEDQGYVGGTDRIDDQLAADSAWPHDVIAFAPAAAASSSAAPTPPAMATAVRTLLPPLRKNALLICT